MDQPWKIVKLLVLFGILSVFGGAILGFKDLGLRVSWLRFGGGFGILEV